jgi:hypothetical protein
MRGAECVPAAPENRYLNVVWYVPSAEELVNFHVFTFSIAASLNIGWPEITSTFVGSPAIPERTKVSFTTPAIPA